MTATKTVQLRRYSTLELQAAASALAAGVFARSPETPPHRLAPLPHYPSAEPDHADIPDHHGPHQITTPNRSAGFGAPTLECLVRVQAANAGAGASTITLALADAADQAGFRTRVLDAASPTWSGLVGASATELGAQNGWRRGRRGRAVLIDRVEDDVQTPVLLPLPREVAGIDLAVLDSGWTVRELLTGAGVTRASWVATSAAAVEVVVTRANTLALGQTETILTALDKPVLDGVTCVIVVVVGAGRRSGPDLAAAGPRLRRLHTDDAVVFVPLLSPKALPGLGPGPLPKQLIKSAQSLLGRITTITGLLPADPA